MNAQGENDRIRISAELPAAIAATRGPITIGGDHQLRCILEVWNKEEIPVLKHRKEVVVEAGQSPVFDFSLESGNYDCLLWADFIKKDATKTEEETSDGYKYEHYEDTYYQTADLKNITVKAENAANLFDTDNCDAFFSKQELKKQQGESVLLTFQMERPLAKLIVKEKNDEQLATLKKLTISYLIPRGFNVFKGEPISDTMTAVFSKEFGDDAPSQELFTGYLFVSAVEEIVMDAVVLGVTTTASTQNREIPSGNIRLKRNQCTIAEGEIVSSEGGIEPEPGDENPQIGDYFFNDGTWSDLLTSENKDKCIGIVYATGLQDGDKQSDYSEPGKQVLGYVVSLKQLDHSSGVLRMYGEEGYTPFEIMGSNNDFEANDGYAKTEGLLGQFKKNGGENSGYYPALKLFYDWRQKQ